MGPVPGMKSYVTVELLIVAKINGLHVIFAVISMVVDVG